MKKPLLAVLVLVLLSAAVIGLVTAAEDETATATPQAEPALEKFEPSEELPADSAISLPVDI